MKRIDYQKTKDGDVQTAKATIDTLETEKLNGNITDFAVEYATDVGAINIHVWHDVQSVSDLPAGYEKVDKALNNLPVSLPAAAELAPVHNR